MPCCPTGNTSGFFVIPAAANLKITNERDLLAAEDASVAKVSPAPAYNVDLYVRNIGRAKFRFLDVENSNTADGAQALAFTLNTPATGNQLWRFQPQEGFNYVGALQCMQSGKSGKFLSVAGTQKNGHVEATSGSNVITHIRLIDWQLIPFADNVFAIKLLHENCKSLYLSCTTTENDTILKLLEVDCEKNLTNFQKWNFVQNPSAA